MKKLIFTLILLLFLPVQSYSVTFICGDAGAAEGCNTSNDSILYDEDDANHTDLNLTDYIAGRFSTSAESDITEYITRICYNDGSGDVSTMIWTDSSNEPGSSISGTKATLAHTEVDSCTTSNQHTFTLDAAYENLSAGTYWMVVQEEGANFISTYSSSASGERFCTSTDGSSWSCLNNHSLSMEIYGCQ